MHFALTVTKLLSCLIVVIVCTPYTHRCESQQCSHVLASSTALHCNQSHWYPHICGFALHRGHLQPRRSTGRRRRRDVAENGLVGEHRFSPGAHHVTLLVYNQEGCHYMDGNATQGRKQYRPTCYLDMGHLTACPMHTGKTHNGLDCCSCSNHLVRFVLHSCSSRHPIIPRLSAQHSLVPCRSLCVDPCLYCLRCTSAWHDDFPCYLQYGNW